MAIPYRHGFLTLLLCCLLPSSALGAGLWLYERGTPEVGTANAGVAARAEDAATAISNPAGMTRLNTPQCLGSLQPLFLDVQFSPDSQTTTSGSSGNADGFIPGAGFFYVHPLGDRWRFGFSFASFFGLGVQYEDDWVGRYYVQESDFLTLSAGPTVAYKVNDWLSLGGGVGIVFAEYYSRAAVNNLSGSDGELQFEDKDIGIGGTLSVLVEPRKDTRFGLAYSSPVKLTFEDAPEFTGLGPGMTETLTALGLIGSELSVDITVPQTVMFSFFHEINSRWAVMGNIGWQDWSEFGQIPVSISSTTSATVTEDRNFDDTWHFALGAHYRFHPQWRVTAGIAHDTSPVSDEDRTVDMALDRTWRYSAGLIWDYSKKLTLGFAYTFLDAGNAPINQTRGPLAGTISGEYSSNYVHIVGLSASYRF
jgi:long-chain fatty acid transport protein